MRSLQFGYFWGGAGGWCPGISNIYLLSICVQIIEIFCCKTAEKIKKIKKKIYRPPGGHFWNYLVWEYVKKCNFHIVRDMRQSHKH